MKQRLLLNTEGAILLFGGCRAKMLCVGTVENGVVVESAAGENVGGMLSRLEQLLGFH